MKIFKFIIIFLTSVLFFVFSPACKEELPVEEITETTPEATESETKNNIPEIKDLKILPDNPDTSQDLTLSYEFNDLDNDLDKSAIKWYENDNYVNDLDNALIIPKIYLDPDDIWYAVIAPYDGRDYGENITSEEVIISRGNINPTIAGNIIITEDSFRTFEIKDNYLYVIYVFYGENSGAEKTVIQVTDINDKSNPQIISSLELGSINFEKMFIKGDYAFIGYYVYDEYLNYTDIGIKIIDLSLKENPKLIDTIEFEGEPFRFYVNEQGDNIYILDNKFNLNIFSLNDDGRFTINKKIKLPVKKTSMWLYILENYAVVPYQVDHYYSIYNAGVQIVDITEDGNARVVSDLSLPGQFMANVIFLNSKYLILGENESIHIFDINDKSNPKDLNIIELPSYFSYIKDDVLYTCKQDSAYDQLYARGEFTSDDFNNIIPNNDSYIQIMDLKDKKNPELLSTFDTIGISNPSSFFEENNYLYCYYTNPDNYGSNGILIIKLY